MGYLVGANGVDIQILDSYVEIYLRQRKNVLRAYIPPKKCVSVGTFIDRSIDRLID